MAILSSTLSSLLAVAILAQSVGAFPQMLSAPVGPLGSDPFGALPPAPQIHGCVDSWSTPFYINRRYTQGGFPQASDPIACSGQLVYLQDGQLLNSKHEPVTFIFDHKYARYGQWGYAAGGYQLCPQARILMRSEEPVFEQCSMSNGASALFDGQPVTAKTCNPAYLAITGFSEECNLKKKQQPVPFQLPQLLPHLPPSGPPPPPPGAPLPPPGSVWRPKPAGPLQPPQGFRRVPEMMPPPPPPPQVPEIQHDVQEQAPAPPSDGPEELPKEEDKN